MHRLIVWFIITIVFVGCGKENEVDLDSIPGRFSLSRLETLKSANDDSASVSNTFYLDSIKASRSFYFVLSNVGQEDISNIAITTDNENFVVSPSAVNTLYGKKNSDHSVLTQVISVDVIHGIRINGVGWGKLLRKGDNYCNISISGQTNNGNENININLTAKIQVFAKVMDIALYKGTEEADLTKPEGIMLLLWNGPHSMNYYNYKENPMVVKNTGNTVIEMNLIHEVPCISVCYNIIQSAKLYPGDTISLLLPKDNNHLTSFLSLDSQGTICDPQRILQSDDGKGYLGLMQPYEEEEEPIKEL